MLKTIQLWWDWLLDESGLEDWGGREAIGNKRTSDTMPVCCALCTSTPSNSAHLVLDKQKTHFCCCFPIAPIKSDLFVPTRNFISLDQKAQLLYFAIWKTNATRKLNVLFEFVYIFLAPPIPHAHTKIFNPVVQVSILNMTFSTVAGYPLRLLSPSVFSIVFLPPELSVSPHPDVVWLQWILKTTH